MSGQSMPQAAQYGRQMEEDMLNAQTTEGINALSARVARLKNITIEISNEVRSQNVMLDEMDETIDRTNNLVGSAISRIRVFSRSKHASQFMYVMGLVFFLFLFLYFISFKK
ncbi:hypothetical protein H696_03884 [Fonticula alba]|uniref:t-SNARE coiled-coil homology domain-containing protein n=1 Tax=Fonticula alba TaxID=691883 RepID=A0A058Z5E1_FONAL|nr:hypothetical protein H696_03884 [Fonticula alba]KCV69455.1 hypothetical protein H696_03884 [Fonticula alba]|eukprot:XP_009496020.1 hypothetical protein H696_03884 [Fonticula alba]